MGSESRYTPRAVRFLGRDERGGGRTRTESPPGGSGHAARRPHSGSSVRRGRRRKAADATMWFG